MSGSELARAEHAIDVADAVGHEGPLAVTVTVVAPTGAALAPRPFVVVAIPGGTYHRRYWDLHPPGREGYSNAEYFAQRGVVFVACDYLGGGDSSRPADGDFIGLETQADAAHGVLSWLRDSVRDGALVPELPPLADATFVGIGQSLGGFVTMIQQGKYDDYPAVGIFGASPLLIANTREQPNWDSMSTTERRTWIMSENARQSGLPELPMYHGAPRDQYRGIFHVPDVPDDLFDYDEAECHTLIPRMAGIDGMTPGFARPFAARITSPVFLAFGEIDVSADPLAEATGYPASRDITTVVIPEMAHMHNFAATRQTLWDRFLTWLPVARLGTGPDR
jgi:alpha-beta hydrolase superfamily lysophospholipase